MNSHASAKGAKVTKKGFKSILGHVILSKAKNPCNHEPKNEAIGPENRFGRPHFEGFFAPLRMTWIGQKAFQKSFAVLRVLRVLRGNNPMQIGTWYYSPSHQQNVQIIEQQTLWGRVMVRAWLPQTAQILQLPLESLQPLPPSPTLTAAHLTYMAAAGRILASLTDPQTLLAPLSAAVIPLPHQIKALQQSMTQPQQRVRYLLADEVGLGKTIEAGLIMKELKLRGLIQRILIVAPKGLVTQWVMELQIHFGETFQLLLPSDFPAYRRLHTLPDEANIWANYQQVICPLDSVKPMEQRRGWTPAQIATYNRERFDDLISAGWDMVIFDESHRLGGSSDQVARYQLGEALAEVTPHLLLLSATPHQGKTDAFRRLMALLDPHTFPDEESKYRFTDRCFRRGLSSPLRLRRKRGLKTIEADFFGGRPLSKQKKNYRIIIVIF